MVLRVYGGAVDRNVNVHGLRNKEWYTYWKQMEHSSGSNIISRNSMHFLSRGVTEFSHVVRRIVLQWANIFVRSTYLSTGEGSNNGLRVSGEQRDAGYVWNSMGRSGEELHPWGLRSAFAKFIFPGVVPHFLLVKSARLESSVGLTPATIVTPGKSVSKVSPNCRDTRKLLPDHSFLFFSCWPPRGFAGDTVNETYPLVMVRRHVKLERTVSTMVIRSFAWCDLWNFCAIEFPFCGMFTGEIFFKCSFNCCVDFAVI